jgi:cytoskeletal protein CcmA (bactofilin family)
MFSSKTRHTPTTQPTASELAHSMATARQSGVPSIISADMTIRGTLKSPGRLQVEGTVLGDIEVGQLVIVDGALVEGEINAQGVEISGALNGLVHARVITLKATARVVGDLHHEVLAIEAGAQLEGQCRRMVPETQGILPVPTERTRAERATADTLQITKEPLRGVG